MSKTWWLIPLALVAASTFGCTKPTSDPSSKAAASTAEPAEGFGKLSVDEVQAKMDEAKAGKLALFVFDNNEKSHFAQGHLPGAKWLDHSDVKASDLPADKEATLVFYCANEH